MSTTTATTSTSTTTRHTTNVLIIGVVVICSACLNQVLGLETKIPPTAAGVNGATLSQQVVPKVSQQLSLTTSSHQQVPETTELPATLQTSNLKSNGNQQIIGSRSSNTINNPSIASFLTATTTTQPPVISPTSSSPPVVAGEQNPQDLLKDVRYKELLTLNPGLQSIVDANHSPRSDRVKVLEMFHKFFTKARSHDDLQQKELVRDGVIIRLRELGFQTSFVQKSRFEFRRRPAFSYNMISIMPGKFRQTKRDRIVLVGAHWDSATQAPGVDDNGSGSTCLLEIARLFSENRCDFNHTVMLVWFDYEEQGKYGSEFFVNEYLFPLELEKYQSKFIGAYILDMILVRDKENNTQMFPWQLKTKLNDFHDELEREKFRGDFLATWSRKTFDEPLEGAFRSSWVDLGFESRTFKAMRPILPQARVPNAEERYEWKDFFRSDHASFWFPQLTSNAVRRSPNRTSAANHTSLNAILLTDLGPWRKSYSKCYHLACDDEHFLTEGNLSFMQQVIDTLVLTLLRVGQGECKGLPPLPAAQQLQVSNNTITTQAPSAVMVQ